MKVLQTLIKHFFNLALITLLFSSCAFHSGIMTGNAAIEDANFTVVGLATGSAYTTHIFSIGGLGKEAIVLEAKRNMYNAYPLQPGQALANVSVDFKRGYYIFFSKTICTISADIIDFNRPPTKADFDNFNAEILGSSTKSKYGFTVGEKVLYTDILSGSPKFKVANISSFNGLGAVIRLESSSGSMFHMDAALSNLYKSENDSSLFALDPIYRIGDSVFFQSQNDFKPVEAKITAIGGVRVAVAYDSKGETKEILVDKKNIRTERTYEMEQSKNEIHGKWALTTLNNNPVPENNKRPTLSIDARGLSISGFSGCNNYFGNFTMEEKGILVGPIGSTRMACKDENIEAAFFKAFGNQIFKIKKYGSTLTLKGTSNTLVFEMM